MKNPFFSVIIPTYNRKDFLKIALDSVLNQTFINYEIIVVDDGSTDDTERIVMEIKNEKINYIYQKNQGPASARNKGIKKARGQFICFLDSDDRFCQEKLATTYEYIKKYPEYAIFHTDEIWYRNGCLLSEKKHHRKPSGKTFGQALKLCCISPSTVAIEKGVFQEIGYFDEQLPACEDYDLFLRISAQYPILLIPVALTIKQGGHNDQQSKKYPAMDRFRIYAIDKLLRYNSLRKDYRLLALDELKNKCRIYKNGALKRNKTKEAEYCGQLVDEWVKK